MDRQSDTRDYSEETLRLIAEEDVRETWRKDVSYSRSWRKRGGVGAFMMLARKWDRLEEFCKRCDATWDIFRSIFNTGYSGEDGTTLAEIRDLRRYLLLVEAEMRARGPGHFPINVEVVSVSGSGGKSKGSGSGGGGMERPFGFDTSLDSIP